MEWPTAEELNLALPPPIQDVQALSLVLSISNVTVTLFIKPFCQMFLLLKSIILAYLNPLFKFRTSYLLTIWLKFV